MNTYRFPKQKTIFTDKPFSGPNLARILEEIFRLARPFTGFLSVAAEQGPVYFLFFLQSDPYAAGKFDGKKPFNINIADFFSETFALPAAQLKVSLNETDPVLLKCMLVLLQEEPTIKAPVTMIDLDQIAQEVVDSKGDALFVLEQQGMFNFFFVKQGMAAKPHMADKEWRAAEDLSSQEVMLCYAFERHSTPVVAHIYRDVTTRQSADVKEVDRERLVKMAKQLPVDPEAAVPASTAKPVTVEILAGADLGKRFNVTLPSSIGRKDCDIVLSDRLASRYHALLTELEGKILIVDQGSTNGTQVNGVTVSKVALATSDIITIGESQLKIIC